MDRMQFSLNALFLEFNFHCIKMRYSIEPKERRYVKGYGFLSYLLLKTRVHKQLKLLKI